MSQIVVFSVFQVLRDGLTSARRLRAPGFGGKRSQAFFEISGESDRENG
jgi:hypothetical protein